MMNKFRVGITLTLLLGMNACSSLSDSLNVFSDDVPHELGNRNNDALLGGGSAKNAENARHALEVMGSYKKALAPQPYYPVVKPAEIRLMWIPDHINRMGDLVPAHYYYLRVSNDMWELQDAFELEEQLHKGQTVSRAGGGFGGGDSFETSTPWQYKEIK